MAFPRFNTETDNISALSDRPNDADGLTAEQLKARFDKAGDDIKSWINTSLIPYLEGTSAASSIGISQIPGVEADNVQDALAEIYNFAEEAYEKATGNRKSPAFSINGGTYAYREQAVGADDNNWELALLSGTNAKITFAKTTGPIDVFLIGGGSPGSAGTLNGYVAKGGSGGRSGKRVTRLNMTIQEGVGYSFSVGGPGNVTKIFGIESRTGTYTEGGDGAETDMTNYPGTLIPAENGGNGEYAFGDASCLLFPGRKYGAGGGGGGVSGQRTITHYEQGAAWQEVIQQNAPGANGGDFGGGHGANTMSHEPGSGADNTGSGGGGAFFYSTDNGNGSGARGTGGSGIIIIRNAR